MAIASERADDDVVIAWLEEACETTRTWNDFSDSGDEFMTLGVKQATARTAFSKDDKTHVNDTSQNTFLLIDEQ